jgi:FAD synthase
MLPATGIYFAHALGAVVPSHALVYVGTRPTLSGVEPRCEVHLLAAPDRELYGVSLEIHLLRRIQGNNERKIEFNEMYLLIFGNGADQRSFSGASRPKH